MRRLSSAKILDDGGKNFRAMLEQGLLSTATIIQLATWNDWGEGTQIEPSFEFGYRDLEPVQSLRRMHVSPQFSPQPEDLRLPLRILDARRKPDAHEQSRLIDQAISAILAGDFSKAKSLLAQ